MSKEKTVDNTISTNTLIDELVLKGKKALDEYMKLDQEQVDKIVHSMVLAGLDNHMNLARLAIDETGRGVFEDKVIKNIFSTEYIWHDIKYAKTVGIISESELDGYMEIAEPVGVVAGVTPVTNPTSTTMFKTIITAKTRNPIIFAFHPSAQKCSVEAARILRDAAIAAGAPKNCVQWIETPSIEATSALMNNDGVSLILATGGSGMVRSAYSSGKPALGVGPGNVPCYINKCVDLNRACNDLMLSKTFDNGMICASEQAVIVDKEISSRFEKIMLDNNCYFLTEEETIKVTDFAMPIEKNRALNPNIVGKTANWIAEQAGVSVPEKTKILIAKLKEVGPSCPLSAEKLSPILAYFIVKDEKEGIDKSCEMLEFGGLGHSAVIHSDNKDACIAFAKRVKAGRILENAPSTHGAIGDIYNTNLPSLTLGCGSYGKNSTASNVTAVNLINKKRLSKRRTNMQWFKIPPKIFFEDNCVQYLAKMPNIKKALIVTDPMMVKLGYVEKVQHYLDKRESYNNSHCTVQIFSDVEPDPSVETIMRGVEAMNKFEPDVIIALGGGSAIDAAKGMWLFYEHPETSFAGARLKFLDIRKRAFSFPNLGNKTKMVAIPTTSGTGSEVTSFTVITDKENGNIKYPLADYELTPDVAIIDPQFVMTMPKSIAADTGMDVLTHAIEAYVSILASDFTDGLAIKAIELVFENLHKSVNEGCPIARGKMHNASAIAGMAFTNSFLGINHSLAHKIGGEYHIPHGRSNAVLLPHVIRYNATKPTKFVSFPKYSEFIADQRYAKIAKYLGLKSSTTEEGVSSLIDAINKLAKSVGIPLTYKDCGVEESVYLEKLDYLSELAFEDQCTTANPRYPLISELKEIYKLAYYGVK